MKSYIDTILNQGEQVISKAEISWFSQIATLIYSVIAAIVIIFIFAVMAFVINEDLILIGYLLAFLEVLSVWLKSYVLISTTEIALTDKRLILKQGLFKRDTKEMPISRIESIELNQSIMGRILNYGSISINGTGGANSPLKCIGKPLDFKKEIDQRKQLL